MFASGSILPGHVDEGISRIYFTFFMYIIGAMGLSVPDVRTQISGKSLILGKICCHVHQHLARKHGSLMLAESNRKIGKEESNVS